ncbi:MAG: tetratricopeptide repeat protein [Bacteroidota bacterium]
MKVQLLLLVLFYSVAGQGQIIEGVTYTEYEIEIQDKFVEAKKYTLIGRFEKAEEILKKLYNDDRKNATIAMELSKVYGYMEDPYNAFRFAKTAFDNDPNSEFVKLNYANICMEQEKFEDAILPLQQLVASNKSSEEYTDQLATAYLQTNNADAALAAYNAIEKQIGINENISRRKFEIYEVLGQVEKALKELENLSEAYPTNLRFMHNLAGYYLKLGKQEKALPIYKKILEIDVNDAAANLAITTASTGEGDDNNYLRSLTPVIENKSIQVDRKILELVPYVDQLNTSFDQELADALIMLADKITIIHPKEAKSHALNGDILLASNRAKDAAKSYEKTLEIKDNVYPVWEGLMEAYTETKDYEDLLRVATEALDLFPNKASAYMYYGRANTFTKSYDEAIDLLNEGLLVSGKDTYHKSNLMAELARAHFGKGDIEGAEKHISNALTMSENKNGLALEINGDLLYQKGDVEGAISYWEKAQKAGIRSTNLADKIEQKKL